MDSFGSMTPALTPAEFRPELLSVREREVVDLAILGQTDEQIAQGLSISSSTVNSYWVRIRGKVGFLSRTEIVAKMLHLGFKDTHAGLLADVGRLTRLLDASTSSLAQSQSDLVAQRGTSWHLLALHFVPEAIFVAESPGDVVYANLQAERLFHSEPGELTGRAVCELTIPDGREEKRQQIRTFMENEKPGRMVIGVEEPCYAQDRNEGNFRATISVEGFEAPGGFMGVFTVREYLGDIEPILRSLRKPLVIA
ncbi:PAS domain-containing protein [bacterium]|nr:MAG: PAS domain-containing protein [bacterium]